MGDDQALQVRRRAFVLSLVVPSQSLAKHSSSSPPPHLSLSLFSSSVASSSLTTIHREYAALQNVGYLDLLDEILSPSPPPPPVTDPRSLAQTMKAFEVNEPQAKAIQGALKTVGFSLVQGSVASLTRKAAREHSLLIDPSSPYRPPGTGKTKTIVGLIGAFLDARPRTAAPIVPGRPTPPSNDPVPKVLLCAPSNAAVDEVAKRLKDGIRNSDGEHFVPKIVRIGTDASVDISVKDVFLDELVERALGGDTANQGASTTEIQQKLQSIRAEIDQLRATRDATNHELDTITHNSARKEELLYLRKTVKGQINDLSQRLDAEKDKGVQSRRAMDVRQKKMKDKILAEADIICATLSGSGQDWMAKLPFDFETVIIDEAAQSVELSSLIPLKYGCKRCVLVGGESSVIGGRLLGVADVVVDIRSSLALQIRFNFLPLSSRARRSVLDTRGRSSFG